jgi:hypothetical protein
LGKQALWSIGETAVDYGTARLMGQDYNPLIGFGKNMAVNSVIGLLPWATEAKVSAKIARYMLKWGVRTVGDASLMTLSGQGNFGENLIVSGTGNLGGDLLGAGLTRGASSVWQSVVAKTRAGILNDVMTAIESSSFKARAARLFDQNILEQLPARIRQYGNGIGPSLVYSSASENRFAISLLARGTNRTSHIFHELGHVLDDIAHPGLFARESAGMLSYKEIVAAEKVAMEVASGRLGRAESVMAALTGLEAKTRIPSLAVLSMVGLSSYILYKFIRS